MKGKKKPKKELSDLLRVGHLMSNVCFNLAQSEKLPDHERIILGDLRKDWDAKFLTWNRRG